MTRTVQNPWLHRFAVATAAATLALIGLGGLVTSHGVGMAVPDWPTTYGYNMFLFPPAYWIGGIFYEHTHRLLASFVGLLTTILAAWLWLKEERRWLRWTGVLAFFAVVFQGVLGGLRVTLYKDELGIFHAALAQSFLVLVSFIALATSGWWVRRIGERWHLPVTRGVRALLMISTLLILVQLVLGAMMRHEHAGLAVPDFPLAYGRVWPPMDEAFIESVNSRRLDTREFNNITAFQIGLHMAHRMGAVLTLGFVIATAVLLCRRMGGQAGITRWTLGWAVLIVGQAGLGAATVLSNKAADIATLHVVLGAMSLVSGALLATVVWRFAPAEAVVRASDRAVSDVGSLGKIKPAAGSL